MTKLSDLKAGDTFSVVATVVLTGPSLTIQLNGSMHYNYVSPSHAENIEVIKVATDLVKGQRIATTPARMLVGEYLGKGWAWWDDEKGPRKLSLPATTEYYVVI